MAMMSYYLTLPYTALPPNCEFVVNFAPELSEAIAETKYLEKLGFNVRRNLHFIDVHNNFFVLMH